MSKHQKKLQKRNHKKGRTGLKRILNATKYSQDGFISAWKEEEGFRQVSVLFVLSLGLGLWLGEGFCQKILLVFSGTLCVLVELFNTAIENAIDHTSLKPHPFAKKAKDMGSAAQLLSLLFFALVWGAFVYERFVS
ncbi:diacylglycerol kinase [Helicobacter sp. MIT 01-3238]|uniref:diacylglycerol kinase n=1 Tax=Helicobacter sp. MIT 01-3238 TaxID=398627 RepID=UPI000E1F88AB|nr:diacylglycerol kinase [Helicobacter sp. MIT 01-3238]RDU55728.1 diacylglycerol kinase [Helicobacter sp. MIT 01-3238]